MKKRIQDKCLSVSDGAVIRGLIPRAFLCVFVAVGFIFGAPLFADFAAPGVSSWPVSRCVVASAGAPYRYSATVQSGASSYNREYYLIAPGAPKALLWVFHGYKPDDDKYLQSPEIFIEKWKLAQISEKYRIAVLIVDTGTTVYPYKVGKGLSEMQQLRDIYRAAVEAKYGALPVITVGVSTGAEGAVKIAPLVAGVRTVIGISGTYNYGTLPEGGEKNLHTSQYGSPAGWRGEAPADVFASASIPRVVIISEEKSMYRAQMNAVMSSSYSAKIQCRAEIGAGHSHNWAFWGDRSVTGIIEEEIQKVIR